MFSCVSHRDECAPHAGLNILDISYNGLLALPTASNHIAVQEYVGPPLFVNSNAYVNIVMPALTLQNNDGPLLFVNSNAFVNTARLHTHVPLECSWYDSYQHWWCVQFELSADLMCGPFFTSVCDVLTHLRVHKRPWPQVHVWKCVDVLSVRSDGDKLFMCLWIYGWRALRVHSPTTTCRQRFCSIMFHCVPLSSTLFCSVILDSLGVWIVPPPLVNSDMIENMDLNCAYLLLLCECNTC
jgi:hypothetical protein